MPLCDIIVISTYGRCVVEPVPAKQGLVKIEDIDDAIFQEIASQWALSVTHGPVGYRPCCSDISCDDENEWCEITLSRPGAPDFVYESEWYPGDVLSDDITPAWALQDAVNYVRVLADHGGGETVTAFEQFCWAPNGNHPQLALRHLIAFAVTSEAWKSFVFRGDVEAELHTSGSDGDDV
jgi:hypothetical protein